MINRKNILNHNTKSNETYKRKLQSDSDLTFDEKKIYRMGLTVDKIYFQDARPLIGKGALGKKRVAGLIVINWKIVFFFLLSI